MVHSLFMELTAPNGATLKINSKKGNVLINPEFTDDAKIVIIDDGAPDISSKYSDSLVIYGPGEYEANGIMVKGTRGEDKTMYVIDTGEGKILHVLSSSSSKLSNEDEFDLVVVKAVAPVEEADLTSLSSKLVVVYGDEQNIAPVIRENRTNKVNLKKSEDITTNVGNLEKR